MAGRKAGGKNKLTIERELRAASGLAQAANEGLMPLDVMIAVVRDELLPDGRKPTSEQFAAAVAAAPYVHPRLTAVAVQQASPPPVDISGLTLDERQLLAKLLRRTKPLTIDA